MIKKLLCLLMIIGILVHTIVPIQAYENTGRNLEQASIDRIDAMPQIPPEFKIIDWKERGFALDDFLFDWNGTRDGRKFQHIYEDSQYGGFMMPAFYGETRPVDNLEKQESITLMGALLQGSLLGNRKDVPIPTEHGGDGVETYLDSALKFYWEEEGIFTNFPDGSTDGSGVKGGENCDFNKQAFNFMTMKVQGTGWKQPDAATGTANILYYAYKILELKNILRMRSIVWNI